MISRTLAAALAVLGMAAATPALATTNLITNGGFEAPVLKGVDHLNIGGGSSLLPGWTVVGPPRNAVSVFSTTRTEPNITFNAVAGDNSLDISGGGNTGLDSGVGQTLNLVSGRLYRLSFWVGNADGSGNGNYARTSRLTLQINESVLTPFENADVTFQHVNWRRYETTFVAGGSPTSITFRNGTLEDSFTGLDNVSLRDAVPEPASWALMIAGFGLAGGALRRRARGIAAV